MIELPFARGEYEQRLKKIRAEMHKRGLDLLIVNDVANQHYITAYDGWSFYTPQAVLVPIEDEEPVWIGRAMDAAGRTDLLIAVGTTLQVYPVAGAVPRAKAAGARIVIINAQATPFDGIADAVLSSPISEVLPPICGNTAGPRPV